MSLYSALILSGGNSGKLWAIFVAKGLIRFLVVGEGDDGIVDAGDDLFDDGALA